MADTPTIEGYSDFVEIGDGGFAVVYRAQQERVRRPVAVKVLKATDLDPRARRRFDRECQAMGALSWHPHVVPIHDSGVTPDGRLWLSMTYFERGSLASALARKGPFDWTEAVDVGVQVAGALDAAHQVGTLHRDVKPENVLIGPYGEARLGDFGIAAVEDSAPTTTGHASFTVGHAAPELLRGGDVDERSDLYALASTLHTLVAGRPPFAGRAGEPIAAVVVRALDTERPRLENVPGDVADLIQAGLAGDPDERPGTVGDFGRALQAIQGEHDLPVTELRTAPEAPSARATPAGPPTEDPDATIKVHPPAAVAAPSPAPGPDGEATIHVDPDQRPQAPAAPEEEKEARAPRRRAILIAAGAIALVLVIGAVLALTRDGGGSDDPSADEVLLEPIEGSTTAPDESADQAAAAETMIARVRLLDPSGTLASPAVEECLVRDAVLYSDATQLDAGEPRTDTEILAELELLQALAGECGVTTEVDEEDLVLVPG